MTPPRATKRVLPLSPAVAETGMGWRVGVGVALGTFVGRGVLVGFGVFARLEAACDACVWRPAKSVTGKSRSDSAAKREAVEFMR